MSVGQKPLSDQYIANTITAGAGAYYFAKKEINADRVAKRNQNLQRKQTNKEMEYDLVNRNQTPGSGNEPAKEAPRDPIPEELRSSLQSNAPYRTQKGDRFS